MRRFPRTLSLVLRLPVLVVLAPGPEERPANGVGTREAEKRPLDLATAEDVRRRVGERSAERQDGARDAGHEEVMRGTGTADGWGDGRYCADGPACRSIDHSDSAHTFRTASSSDAGASARPLVVAPKSTSVRLQR